MVDVPQRRRERRQPRRASLVGAGVAVFVILALAAIASWVGPRGGLSQDDVAVSDGPPADVRPDADGSTFSRRGWSTDFARSTVPLVQIEPGGPPKDGIPSIDRPQFITTSEASAFLLEDEPVMVVRRGSDARAYPLQILIWHEIVNDAVGSEPVVITYCPLCNTALAFSRSVEGRVLDFGTTGNLRHSDLVMYDRQTESWWQQATGEAIVGTFAGKQLQFVPASIIAYQDFRAAYPAGRVLARPDGFARPYGTNPYVGYDSGTPFRFGGEVAAGLRANERVVTVALGDEAVAYPFPVLARERVLNDDVGGKPIVVFFRSNTRSALDAGAIPASREVGAGVVFSRELERQELTFRPDGTEVIDLETGSHWDITGRAVLGPLAGAQLEPLVHGNPFWFAWAVFQPATRLYGR